ncbi:MAG: endonuclease domain-containing protein [Candidatus Binataceae bacterium]
MRAEPTAAEQRLWYLLRGRKFEQFKFCRQFPIGRFIVDFCCVKSKLIVELDGAQHIAQIAYDEARTKAIERRGFSVVRFWNHDVMESLEDVLEEILRLLRADDGRN